MSAVDTRDDSRHAAVEIGEGQLVIYDRQNQEAWIQSTAWCDFASGWDRRD